jgi:abequosyltransferase
MAAPRLTVCMPTFNYGRYIRTAIDSVRDQGVTGVEVLVLDGGSTDDTREVVERAVAEWPAVRYVPQEERGGIDADLARSVELATGEYCWLLSADDRLEAGALRRILAEFEQGNDILLCDRVWCDAELKPLHPQSWLAGRAADRAVDLSSAAEVLDYLRAAQSLGALFSFMSCIGFKRAAWLRAAAPAVPCYSHVGRLFAMGRGGARFKYLAAPLVSCRGGADSFRAGGLARRLLIDLRGFRQLADGLFAADAACHAAFLAVMRREHPLRQWIGARLETPDSVLWGEVEQELAAYGFSWLECALASFLGVGLAMLRKAIGRA